MIERHRGEQLTCNQWSDHGHSTETWKQHDRNKADEYTPLHVPTRARRVMRANSHYGSEVCLHLNSDAVDRLSRSIENPSERLGRHVHHQTSLPIPILDRLHDIAVRRQFSAIRSTIVHRPLHLIEHENRRPSMMMDRLFVV